MKLTGNYNGKTIELELTEEQVKILEQAGKNKTGWERVEKNQPYYVNYADDYGWTTECFEDVDTNRYKNSNYFSDETLAKNIIRAQTLQRKLWRRSAELCEKMNWENPITKKYYIYYDCKDCKLSVTADFQTKGFGEVCFDTMEHAKQVIEEFRNELIWYFTAFKSRMD